MNVVNIPHIESAVTIGKDTKLNVICPFCKKKYSVTVSTEGYKKVLNKEMIQVALRGVSAEIRESVQTGICQECWDREFEE